MNHVDSKTLKSIFELFILSFIMYIYVYIYIYIYYNTYDWHEDVRKHLFIQSFILLYWLEFENFSDIRINFL